MDENYAIEELVVTIFFRYSYGRLMLCALKILVRCVYGAAISMMPLFEAARYLHSVVVATGVAGC